MKKVLLATLLSGLAVAYVRADLIWNETFNYINGSIIAVGTNSLGVTNWFRHSGIALPSDAFVTNHKLEVSATGSTVSRADDVNRPLGSPYTDSQRTLYASFTVNCTNRPTTASTYFAHFSGHTSGQNLGRVFALAGVLPNTWRLGIAATAGAANKVYPVDLATNTDYQVVEGYDPVSGTATLWVNATSASDLNLQSGDSVTPTGLSQVLTNYAFRQAGTFGNSFFNITNLSAATTFDEASTAVWSTTPVAPAVVYQAPAARTNFAGDNVSISIVAAGQGLGALTYAWQKNGGSYVNPAGNTNVLIISGAQASDSGTYSVVVTTPLGQSATSANSYLWVTNPPIAPVISQQPSNQTVYFGQTATITVAAGGAGISYAWKYNNGALGPNCSGDGTPTLTVSDCQTNNGTAGTYRCDLSNVYGTTPSSNAVLTVIAPPLVSIGYLRTLVDPVFFLPTNTTSYYSATGVVTVFSTMTAPQNASFVMQDGTNAIGVFVAGGYSTMPQAGDNIKVTAPLSAFNGALQFNLAAGDTAASIVTNSNGNLQPAGTVLPFGFTNGATIGGAGNAMRYYGGRIVTFTNVYFPVAFGGPTNFASGSTYTMTNINGESFRFFMNAAMTNLNGYPIPTFAWTVRGPMTVFLTSNTTADRSSGYELTPTRIEDIVSTPPPSVTQTIALAGGQPSLTWVAQPFMSYSILRAVNVQGPYLPIVTGLTFNTTAGQYTDTTAGSGPAFYRIISP